jgi:NADH kinase
MRLACMFYNKDFSRKSQDVDGMKSFHSFVMKLNPVLDWQVMNEIALHRGSSPHLNTIDIFVDGQHLTEAVVCLRVLEKINLY